MGESSTAQFEKDQSKEEAKGFKIRKDRPTRLQDSGRKEV